ncbi:MAG: hypothetical protein JEY79_03545 [Pseudodesulfovibrio sp.]|nr:hypothetical protein [Pseudodesulfovibrio sp.]
MGKTIRTPVAEMETIAGVLIPSGWGEQFMVTRISLACDGEIDILVGNLDAHPEMHVHIRKWVQAVGTISRDGESEVMQVASFRLLDEGELAEF